MLRRLSVATGWLLLAYGVLTIAWGFINKVNEPLWPGIAYSAFSILVGFLLLWCAGRVCEGFCRLEGRKRDTIQAGRSPHARTPTDNDHEFERLRSHTGR